MSLRRRRTFPGVTSESVCKLAFLYSIAQSFTYLRNYSCGVHVLHCLCQLCSGLLRAFFSESLGLVQFNMNHLFKALSLSILRAYFKPTGHCSLLASRFCWLHHPQNSPGEGKHRDVSICTRLIDLSAASDSVDFSQSLCSVCLAL